MIGLLDSLCVDEKWRSLDWKGSWICGGSPLRDPAVELLFKQGLPPFRKALLVNWGCGAWLNLLDIQHGWAEAVHVYREDEILFNQNRERLTGPRDVSGRVWLPGDVAPSEWEGVDLVLVRIWKEMDYNLAWLGALLKAVPAGCSLQFIGHKEDGIRNLEKKLSIYGRVDSLAVGCHSRWLGLESPGTLSSDFPSAETGLFGAGRMDQGTRLLLEHAGPVEGLSICDLGCGSGEIALWALRHGAKHVVASDHQFQAVDWVRKRSELAGCEVGCHFMGEGLDQKFDCVLTNPPFHLQGQTRLLLGQVWLKAAKALLAPEGCIRLVCNEFLDYPRFARDNGLVCRELAFRQGFRVYEFSMSSAQ